MNEASIKPTIASSSEGKKFTFLGTEITIKVDSSSTGGDYYIFESTTPPGDGIPPHIHSREDEIFEILDGQMDIFLDGETYTASRGDIAFFPRNSVHGFSNSGASPAVVRVVVSPGANFEKFFEELAALPSTTPPDMEKITSLFEQYGLPIAK